MSDGPWALPPGWRWVRLGELCEINPRRPHFQRPDDALTSFVPMSAVDETTGTVSGLETKPYADVKRGYTYFETGDVLFAKITPSMQNGKAAVAHNLIDGFGFGSTEFHVLRPKSEVGAEWVWLFVRQERFRRKAMEAFRGAIGQQRVPQEFMETCLIPLPSLLEQRRVVARIRELAERIREAKRLREEARRDADMLMEAALAEVFPRPGSPLSAGWRWVRLGEVCVKTERRDPSKKPETLFTYVDISAVDNAAGQIVFAKILKGADAPSRARKVIRTADVIFATTRPYLKNIVLVPPELDSQICSTGFCVIRANCELAMPQYLFHLCRSDCVIDQLNVSKMRGANYPAVTDNDIYGTLIPLPPLTEQQRIVAYLDNVQAQASALRQAQEETAEELNRLEQAILDCAFRGEL